MYYNNDNPCDYIDNCYKVSTYLKTYSHLINPTNGKDMWPKSIMPPIIPNEVPKPKKGRRQIMRKKEPGEGSNGTKNGIVSGKVSKKGTVMHCSICGSTEHNKRYHGKQGSDATQPIPKKLPVRRNKSVGQSGGLHSISMPHTMQWMPDVSSKLENL
ncbi:uncharacterized protein LOC131008151 [Salvia miltiorrhiza]|uniref:uncharacterized protein LOC131008151 n=1 Tax=Salvia miltiorrhiza TaxID=226208 RepID=UPI0025AB8F56|nr:uncharacterized protein LOC131008151 [Salvia miltiorrhiza]